MLTNDIAFQSCLSGLIRGLRYILSKQIRGWPNFVNQNDPDCGTTGHVLFLFDLLGLQDTDSFEQAVPLVEESAHQRDGRVLWRSAIGGDIFGPRESLAATILGIAGTVYGIERGLVGRIAKKEVALSLDHCIQQYRDKAETDPEAGLWEFFMLSYLSDRLHVLSTKSDTLLSCLNAIWDNQAGKFRRDLLGDCENAAKGLLGLSYFAASDVRSLESHLLQFLLKRKQESGTSAYWDRNPSHPETTRMGPFFVTRWVVMALARYSRRGAGIDRTLLDKSAGWLLSKQYPDGSWKERPEDVVGPGFCVYALTALWEYLLTAHPKEKEEASGPLQDLCLQFSKRRQICYRRMSRCTEDINRGANSIFVLMPYDESFEDVYHAIGRAAPGEYSVERADTTEFRSVDIVCQNICKKIQESRLVVADISEDNPNVFYEIGLAHGMGQEVWLISKKRDRYPFDVMGLQFIEYKNLANLEEKLRERLLSKM
jgi:hypothetical protein